MQIRPYQAEIIKQISDALFVQKLNRVLVYSSTGSGKTIIAKFIISRLNEKGKKVLFTVPRRKLAFQTQKSFGFGNIIMSTDTEDNKSLCTIATIQSLLSRKITEHFDYVIIDEGHFSSNSEQIKYIKETWKNSKIIALSATPIDENGYLITGYDKLINVIEVAELIKLGFLVDVDVYTSSFNLDLSKVDIVNGDYNQEQASKVVRQAKVLTNTVQEWERLGNNLKTLVFACNIEHAESLKTELSKKYKVGAVHSKMTETEIEQAYTDFHNNDIQLLINVDMATFGFNEPSIECLLFARPIKSLRLYKQMVGRGLRTFEGKSKCLIIDCANIVKDNGFPTEPIQFIKKPVISKRVDLKLNIERDNDGNIRNESLTKERYEYLQRISNILDLYADRIYTKEADLVEDLRTFLNKTNYFFWRQNSGTAKIDDRYVQFTDKKGLPDLTLIYSGVYVGLEAKLERGTLTENQKITLPELINKGDHIFILKSVLDLFDIMEHLNKNIIQLADGVTVLNSIYNLPQQEINYRNKYKLPIFEIIK